MRESDTLLDKVRSYNSWRLVLPLIGYLAGCGNGTLNLNGTSPSSSQNGPTDPIEICKEFSAALQAGDLEKALSYVHPWSKTMRGALSGEAVPEQIAGLHYGRSLTYLGEQLTDISLTLKEEYGNYRNYTFPCGGIEVLQRINLVFNHFLKVHYFKSIEHLQIRRLVVPILSYFMWIH